MSFLISNKENNNKEQYTRKVTVEIMKGKTAIYGFNDKEHSIECVIEDIKFKGTDILLVAKCEGGTITAPAEMFQILD